MTYFDQIKERAINFDVTVVRVSKDIVGDAVVCVSRGYTRPVRVDKIDPDGFIMVKAIEEVDKIDPDGFIMVKAIEETDED